MPGIIVTVLIAALSISVFTISQGATNSNHHRNVTREYARVDGLANEDVVVLITSSLARSDDIHHDHSGSMSSRLIPGVRTWMKGFSNIFVLLEDNIHVRLLMRHCKHHNFPDVVEFHCHGEPTYVLTRNCQNDEGSGRCCRVDVLVSHIAYNRLDLYKHAHYFLHGDDDTYWRGDQVMRWLARLHNAGVDKFPIISNEMTTITDHHIFDVGNCTEVFTNGFYQPVMLNKAAIERMKVGHAAFGFETVCKSFDKYQDVGFGIWAWMYQLYHVFQPLNQQISYGREDAISNQSMTVHGAKAGCDHESTWPVKYRRDQSKLIGNGDMSWACPRNNTPHAFASMYLIHKFFLEQGENVLMDHREVAQQWLLRNVTLSDRKMEHNRELLKDILDEQAVIDKDGKFKGQPVVQRVIPTLRRLPGYEKTRHGRKHDIVKKFVAFGKNDCDPPGVVNGKP